MFGSGPFGFSSGASADKAPVAKALLVSVGVGTFVTSALDVRTDVHSALRFGLGHGMQNLQLWRLFTHHFFAPNPATFFLHGALIFVFRLFERRYGSAKFAAMLLTTGCLATTFELAALAVGGRLIASPLTGPYVFVFALFVPFFFDVSSASSFNISGGGRISHKMLVYMIGAYLALASGTASALPAACGLLAGIVYRFGPSAIRRLRFPAWFRSFCASYILPFVDSAPPTAPTGTAGRPHIGRPQPRFPGDPMFPGNTARAAAAAYAAPSAPPAPAHEPPSEGHIDVILAMGFSREDAVRALAASGNNIERAADILLSGS